MRVGIVGCGVAGSVLGHLLGREQGIEVVCFERARPGEHAEAGTGLNVGPNALKALELCDPDQAQRVRDASYPWNRWKVSTSDGGTVFDFALTELADNPGIRIRWSELYRILREPLGRSARFGARVTNAGYDPRPGREGTLFVEYTDEADRPWREDGFDLLVAADGRYSALRGELAGQWPTHHVGSTIGRLLVPDTSGGLVDDYGWWLQGNDRLLAFRVPTDQIYIAASFPIVPGSKVPAERLTPEALARAYLPANGGGCEAARWMVDQLVSRHDQIHWARLQESPPLFRDPAGRVLFLGDSAHGMVPTLGQGATQAIEDACTAATIIARGHALSGDVPATTLEIAALREPRVRWVMELSLDATAALLEGGDPVRDTARLREPPYREALRRLWSGVALG
jgi:salicylate hydroxylase